MSKRTNKQTKPKFLLKVLIHEKIRWGVSESEAFLFSYGFF